MSPPKREFVPEPRIWSPKQLADWFGRGLEWFRDRRTRLEAAGFPGHDDLLGGTDADAAKAWLDARSGLTPDQGDDEWMEAMK